jgi:formyl-CoA transferase
LLSDERYASGALRSRNRAELNAAVEARLRTRTTEEWVEALNEAGVPAGPVNTIDQVFADPQVEHLGLTATVHHPRLGDLRILPHAVTMTDSPGDAGAGATREPPDAGAAAGQAGRPAIRRPSPDPGQHTDEVLSAAGFAPTEIARLRARGVIA